MGTEYSLHVGTGIKTFKMPFKNVIPNSEQGQADKLENLELEVKIALNNMLGQVDLEKLNSKSKVVIVSDDYTRPTPTHKILPELIGFLYSKGVEKENISILIGAGFHREMTWKEKMGKFGEEICSNFNIYHHDALDNENLRYLGETKDGVPVYINKLAVEADFLIGIGVVEIHPWAGFAGGPKIICPGVAGKKTINYTHALPVIAENVEIGTIDGNPFWENILEVSKMAGLDFVINVVLNNDEEVCAVFAGEAEKVQRRCIQVFNGFNLIEFPEMADVVITTSNPKYQYWGQAAIAGYNAGRVIKEGGTRIIIAECTEGFGDSQQEIVFYFDSLRDKWDDLNVYWDRKQGVEMDNSRNTCAIHRHLSLLEKSDMVLVTKGFPPSTPEMKSQKVVKELDEALDMVYRKYGPDAKVIVYDMGAMVLPSINKEKNGSSLNCVN